MKLRDQGYAYCIDHLDGPERGCTLCHDALLLQVRELMPQPQPDPQPNTVTVRIAVAVNGNGDWYAVGSSAVPETESRRDVSYGIDRTDQQVSIVTATLPIPQPPEPTEVRGEVEET